MDKKTQEIFQKIAEGNDKERVDAAMTLVNGASDQTLKSELSNFGITMLQAKNSVEMEKVTDALNLYFKKQMALIFCQAFTYGQKYQHAIDLVMIPEAVKAAEEEISKKTEAAEEISE